MAIPSQHHKHGTDLMIHLTADTHILLATEAADFRKGIDGFVAICTHHLQQNPRNGSLYVFCNRASTMIRILSYESNGYYLITKRLSRGRFKHWPKANATMSAVQAHTLRQLLLNTLEPSTPHG